MKFYRLSDATFYDRINTIYQFIKPFLDKNVHFLRNMEPLNCHAVYIKMPSPFLIFSQSDYLILVVDTNSHTHWQTVQIQISWSSQLIWSYTVCKRRTCPGLAGQGLRLYDVKNLYQIFQMKSSNHDFLTFEIHLIMNNFTLKCMVCQACSDKILLCQYFSSL